VLKSEESMTPKNLKAPNANKLNFNPQEFPFSTTANFLLNSTEDKKNLRKSWTNKDNSGSLKNQNATDNYKNYHFQTDNDHEIGNFVGFATAAGTKVDISKEALDKAKKTLAMNARENSIKENSENLGFSGFATAAGIKVNISKEALEKAKKTLAVKASEESTKNNTENPVIDGYNTVSEELVTCETVGDSKKNIAAVKSSGDNDNVDKQEILDSACLGFTTASGNKVSISDKALSEAKKRFASQSDGSNSYNSELSSRIESVTIPNLKSKSIGSLKTVSSLLISQVDMHSHSTSTINQNNGDIQGIKQLATQRKLTTTSTGVLGASEIKVNVSERADVKSKRKLEDSTDFNLVNKILAIDDKRDSNDFLGFTTALGNKVHISEKAIHQAKSMLGFRAENLELQDLPSAREVDAGFEQEKAVDKAVKSVEPFEKMKDLDRIDTTETTFTGFMTAGGNKVDISEKARKEAKQKMNIDVINDLYKTGFTGFMTAGGKNVDISEKALKEAQQKLNIDYEINEPNKTSSMGFITAGGKNVNISEKAMKEAKNKMNIVNEDSGPSKTGFTGFKTAGGKKVDISEKAMRVAKHKMNIVNEDSDPFKTGFTGFKTAGGNKVEISEKAMKLAQQKMETLSNKENENRAAFSGFKTAGGNKVEISKKAMLEAKNRLGIISELSPSCSNASNKDNIKHNMLGFTSASGKSVSISEKALKHAKHQFGSNSCETKLSNSFGTSTDAKYTNTAASNTQSDAKTVTTDITTVDSVDELTDMEFSFDDNLNVKDLKVKILIFVNLIQKYTFYET
jgi:hypothetical protein